MHILFLTPPFYGYYNHIYDFLVEEGHQVDMFKSPASFLYKLVTTLWGLFCSPANWIRNNHFKMITRQLNASYDCIFAIRGSEVPDFFYDYLKERYPNARFIQYMWDDVSLDERALETVKYFDKILSFNPKDCERYGFVFRPFFYNENLDIITNTKPIDIMMIGSYNYKRFLFAKQILKYSSINNISSRIIIRASVFLFLTNHEHFKYKQLFHSSPVPYVEMMKMLGQSKTCVEICAEGQDGLSTRQFESLFTRTKVITNNKNVQMYDFYNPDNIFILDNDNLQLSEVPISWINMPYVDINKEVLSKYSLRGFMLDVLA